jgi:hypothetical protein
MKELGQLFITMVITAAWCAMWFIVVSNEIEFPALLHGAFAAVMLFNGYQLTQTIKATDAYNKQVLANLGKTTASTVPSKPI